MKEEGSIFRRSSKHAAGHRGARVMVHHCGADKRLKGQPLVGAWTPQIVLGLQGTAGSIRRNKEAPLESGIIASKGSWLWLQISALGVGMMASGNASTRESRDQARPAPSPWTLMPKETVFIIGRSMESNCSNPGFPKLCNFGLQFPHL